MIEFGPGLGTLTGALLRAGARVLAIDADRDMLAVLGRELGEVPTFSARHGDATEAVLAELAPAGRVAVAGNLPYAVTGGIFRNLVAQHQSVARALRGTPEPSIFWLLFQGLSETRTALLSPPSPEGMAVGDAAKKALKLLKLGKAAAVGESPGIYEAPEKKGFNGLQALVTVGLAALALSIGLIIALLAAGMTFG